MRLIDADALLTSVYRKYGVIDALEDIRNATTVEAEPVRHSHDEYGKDYIRHCSCNGATRCVISFGNASQAGEPNCKECMAKMGGEAQAVEPEPVRHEKWVFDAGSGGQQAHCSGCGERVHYYVRYRQDENGKVQAYWDFTPYCPVCGAKMDEEASQ